MATRFFFPETEAAPVSPTISGDWEHINTQRRKLLTGPDSSTLTTTAYTPDGADHLVNGDAHHRQYVSDPLAAQNIAAQTVKLQFQCLEAHAGNNLFLTWKIFVVSQDGNTIKETLLAIRRDATEVATSLTNRGDSATTTAADVEDNDRIVIEIGLGGTPTGSGGVQGHNGSIRFGCNASSGDLGEDNTQTGTTFRPWLEFANTLTFAPLEIAETDTISLESLDSTTTITANNLSTDTIDVDLSEPELLAVPVTDTETLGLETNEQSPLILVSISDTDILELPNIDVTEFIFVPVTDSDMIDIEILDGEIVTPSGGGTGTYRSYMQCYTYGIGY